MADSSRSARLKESKDEDPFTLPMLSPKTAAVLFAPTSRRTAPRDDVSYRKDSAKNKAAQAQIPPTKIPEQYHIREESPAPPRQEVLLLEQWLDRMLLESQQQHLGPIEAVKRAQQLYAQAFNEILRQVYVTCMERGELLNKIWSRYLQLFDHVLKIRDKERVQYNQKLQQQKLMYQQLYKDKDDAFNQVYLQLAAEKERIQMSRDKLERAVLLMQDDIRKRVRKETRLKRVVHHLRMRAKEMNVEEEPDEGYESDDSLLPPDLTADSFSESNVVVVNKLRYIEDKLQHVRKSIPTEAAETNFGSLLELDSLLHSLSDTISRLTTTEDTPALRHLQQTAPQLLEDPAAQAGPGDKGIGITAVPPSIARHSMGIPAKFHIDKAVQYSETDIPSVLPKPFLAFYSRSMRMLVPQPQEKSWALAHIGAIFALKIISDEECDAREAPRLGLAEFTYSFFVSLYGIRTLAEQALADLMATCVAHAESNRRIRMFLLFSAGTDLTRDDLSFFLYTLAQFYERHGNGEADISYTEASDGTQWLTMETVRLVSDIILRDQDADAREAVLAACEKASNGTNKIDLDLFLEAMTARAHTIGVGPEEQLTGLYNSAIAVDSIASPTGAIIYDDLCALVRGFSAGIGEAQMQKIFRDVLDELGGDPPAPTGPTHAPPPYGPLPAIIRVCRAHGLLGWKRCGELVFTMIASIWSGLSIDLMREVAELAALTSPDAARLQLLVQERQEELQKHLEARDNYKTAVSSFRSFNEQLWFARRRERKFVQGRPEQPAAALLRSRT
eukprot:m51a1_g320 hypothetical protein (787) ;mRNA; f:431131-434130